MKQIGIIVLVLCILLLNKAVRLLPEDLTLTVLLSAFVIVIGYNLYKSLFTFMRTRNGAIVPAELMSYNESSNWKYQLTLKYHDPIGTHEYITDFDTLLIHKPEHYRNLRIWFNKHNPEKSILVNQYDWFWMASMILGSGLMVYLIFWIVNTNLT